MEAAAAFLVQRVAARTAEVGTEGFWGCILPPVSSELRPVAPPDSPSMRGVVSGRLTASVSPRALPQGVHGCAAPFI
ncbi:hypothetical protein GCM10009530_51250 [Microbispora corallina]